MLEKGLSSQIRHWLRIRHTVIGCFVISNQSHRFLTDIRKRERDIMNSNQVPSEEFRKMKETLKLILIKLNELESKVSLLQPNHITDSEVDSVKIGHINEMLDTEDHEQEKGTL